MKKFTSKFIKFSLVVLLVGTLLSSCSLPRCTAFHPQNAPKPTGYVIIVKPGQPVCYLPTYK